jgi:hypothetical protein
MCWRRLGEPLILPAKTRSTPFLAARVHNGQQGENAMSPENSAPSTDPMEGVEPTEADAIVHPEQPPMDDAASGLPEDENDEMTDNS